MAASDGRFNTLDTTPKKKVVTIPLKKVEPAVPVAVVKKTVVG